MARAPINGETLRWARQASQVTAEDLAATVGVKPDRIAEFESEDSKPTFRQLTLLATKLDRPLGFFFAAAPNVVDVPQTADFRGRPDEGIPSDLTREMRRVSQHRESMLDLAQFRVSPVLLSEFTWNTASLRAEELRTSFGLTSAFTPPESQQNQVFNFWRGLLEAAGILVFQSTRIPLSTFRGLSVHHEVLPIILVNGSDSAAGRTFTLFHEVAHLSNQTNGLCVLNEDVYAEALANAFAAHFLMPEDAVRNTVGDVSDPQGAAESLAGRFKVSPLAAGVRLLTLDLIDEADLAQIRKASDAVWAAAREQQKNSKSQGPPPWRLRYRDLGSTYIGTVAQALEDRRVDIVDASYLLNARVPMVEQLLQEYYRTGGAQE